MTLKVIKIGLYLAIVTTMLSLFTSHELYKINKSILLVLISLFIFLTLINQYAISKVDNIEYSLFHKISMFNIVMISCFISSVIIGIQYQDEYSGNPLESFGPPINLIFISLIFPLIFSLFIFSLSIYKKWIFHFITLIIWEIISIYIAYFQDYKKNSGGYSSEGSSYFSSDTKLITPVLQIIIGGFIAFIFIKNMTIPYSKIKIIDVLRSWTKIEKLTNKNQSIPQ